MGADVEAVVVDLPKWGSASFHCDLCDQICLSKRGLTRHTSTKHYHLSTCTSKTAEELLHPLHLKKYIQKSVLKLAADECYPDEIMEEFKLYNVGNLNKVNHTYQYFKEAIKSFNGDAEKFYPVFYKCVSGASDLFPGLSRNCSLLL